MKRILLLSFLVLFSCSKDSNEVLPEIIKPKYQVIISAGEGGSVDSFGGSFTVGNFITVTATPNEGYMFSSWSNGSQSHILEFEVTSNLTLVANFELLVNSYDIMISAGEGGSVSNEGGSFNEGSTFNTEALPNDGYKFVNWSNGSTEPNISFEVTENINLEAIFEELPKYQVTFNETIGGIISAIDLSTDNVLTSGEFYQGYVINLIAIPEDGYRFKKWIGLDSFSNEVEISIASAMEISAEFEPIPFDVNDMDNVKYPLYNKDTLSGKKVDTKQLNFSFFTSKGLDIREINLESNLDYLASENFIVYWDKRYDHTNYAIDILRWSEFSAIKASEMGMPIPKDFDTYRMNIFITRDDEYGEDIFPGTQCQCAHTVRNSTNDTNGRRYMTFPWYNNFTEGQTQLENYPRMAVPHEVFHTFQKNNRSWLSESTAEYFEGKLFAELRPNLLRFIPDFLYSTHFTWWSGYDNNGNGKHDDDDIKHIYGKQLLWYYLDWNGYIDNNFLGRLNNFSQSNNNHIGYLIDNITNFRELYFDFAMKSTVIDFPKWSDRILHLLNQNFSSISRYDGYKRHELILKTNNNQITKIYDEYNYDNEFLIPSVDIGHWGFSSYKIQSESNNSYKVEIETDHLHYRLGLILSRNNQYLYSEVNSGDIINFQNNDEIYIVIVDIPEENICMPCYGFDNPAPYKIKFSLHE